MDINVSILGFLSWKPLTGYELKKCFSVLDFIPWSGNNNQIYKVLVSLHKEGYVTKDVVHQESLPSKKVYSITQKGLDILKEQIKGKIDAPSVYNDFLLHLAWADILSREDFLKLLDKYQETVEMDLLSTKEKARRKEINPARSKREEFYWDMVWQNRISFYQNELNWLTKLRNGIANK